MIELSLLLQDQEIMLQKERKFYPNHKDQNTKKVLPLPRVQNILIFQPTSSQYRRISILVTYLASNNLAFCLKLLCFFEPILHYPILRLIQIQLT